MPSSRFASRFASCECWSSARVLTAGIVFAFATGGAECDGGGGDVELGPPYVPCRLKETGLAVCGPIVEGNAPVERDGSDGAKGLLELRDGVAVEMMSHLWSLAAHKILTRSQWAEAPVVVAEA